MPGVAGRHSDTRAQEPSAGAQVREAMEAEGITVHLGGHAARVERADGRVTVELDDGTSIEGDELLCALGRRLLTDDLGLDTIGLVILKAHAGALA